MIWKGNLMAPSCIDWGSKFIAKLLLADIFIGPQERLTSLPPESIICVANHTWYLDVITTRLICKTLGRDYSVVASPRVMRALGKFSKTLGLVPVSANPLANIRTLKSALAQRGHNSSLWIFPQAVWIPRSWPIQDTIPPVAENVLKMLNRDTAILPIYIELLAVRQIRVSAVVTVGNPLPKSALSSVTIGDKFAELRAETLNRLDSHCSEYYSILHKDGIIFCGYPIRRNRASIFLRRKLGVEKVHISATTTGWDIKLKCAPNSDQDTMRKKIFSIFPGVAASRMSNYVKLELETS
jgi:1-acyl-sn-glycerol-3-phosphate acyltransferase